MSQTRIHAFNADPTVINAAVVNDVLDFTPDDLRVGPSYAVTTRPGGSSASFTGAKCTLDVVGSYLFTVTVGSETLVVKVFCFSAANYSAIQALGTGTMAGTYTDAATRQVLGGIAGTATAAQCVTWAGGGAVPSVNLRQFGGAP